MSLNYQIIGKRVKELRVRQGLSQEKLAEMCNLAVSHISRIESGKKHPSLECLVRLGNVLGVTANTFLCGNQKNDLIEHKLDFLEVVEDCNNYEKQILLDVIKATKKTLRENNFLVQWTNF